MNQIIRAGVSAGLSIWLVLIQCTGAQVSSGSTASGPSPARLPLNDYLNKPYIELFSLAPEVSFSASEVQKQRDALKRGEDVCRKRYKEHTKNYQGQMDEARKDLKRGGPQLKDEPRKQLHCRIQNLELLRSEAEMLAEHAIPTAYDNLNAKLDLLMQWPAENRAIQQEIASGTYNQRRWADVKDIGFRDIALGQRDDIKRGQEAIEQLKRNGLLPPELQNEAIQKYVKSVADRVAQHSDLMVPLHVSVLQSREINAFALPGGYLFIERGLLETVDDESQLAGVIAHEIAHDTARHGAKLMKRATIAGIFYQAAQIAAVVLTGGIAGIGMYYALQYGFYGLGLVLDLKLLGITRDYELEADQLGVQYAWNAGYDPSGFIRFFDKMASKEGYVNGVSWFRTHPPFYDRMVLTQREIMFMPKRSEQTTQTNEFAEMKNALKPIAAEAEKEEANRPSLLLSREQGCSPPAKLEYKPDQPIEQICNAPLRSAGAE